MDNSFKTFVVKTEAELLQVAAHLQQVLQRPCLILLNGNLGAGKTTFMGYFLQVLDLPYKVTSPTFAKVHEYAGPAFTVFHLDLYRALPSLGELEEILTTEGCIVCMEWGSRLTEIIDLTDLSIQTWILNFEMQADESRLITLNLLE